MKKNELLDVPQEVIKASIALAAGFGFSLNMCGALTGASLALGVKYGRNDLSESVGRRPSWSRAARLVEHFKSKYHTVSCAEMTWGFGDFASASRIQRCMGIIDFTTCEVVRLLFNSDDTFTDPEKEDYFGRRELKRLKKSSCSNV